MVKLVTTMLKTTPLKLQFSYSDNSLICFFSVPRLGGTVLKVAWPHVVQEPWLAASASMCDFVDFIVISLSHNHFQNFSRIWEMWNFQSYWTIVLSLSEMSGTFSEQLSTLTPDRFQFLSRDPYPSFLMSFAVIFFVVIIPNAVSGECFQTSF